MKVDLCKDDIEKKIKRNLDKKNILLKFAKRKSKGKRRETRYICQLCLVPLHIT